MTADFVRGEHWLCTQIALAPPEGAVIDKKVLAASPSNRVVLLTNFIRSHVVSGVPLCAVGCVVFTVNSAEASRAGTCVAVDKVSAVGAVLAGVALTLVDVLLALGAPETRQAGAQEAINLIHTPTSVTAGVCAGRIVGRRRVES